jgi:hypothetical protein
MAEAQAAVTAKYRQYEELAGYDGSRFRPDASRPNTSSRGRPVSTLLGPVS